MSKRKHSVSTFKEIWLIDPIFQLWIAKVRGDPSLAWCKLCKSYINISKMGKSTLNDHAKENRQLGIIEEWQKSTNTNFFKPPSSLNQQLQPFEHWISSQTPWMQRYYGVWIWWINTSYNSCSNVREFCNVPWQWSCTKVFNGENQK